MSSVCLDEVNGLYAILDSSLSSLLTGFSLAPIGTLMDSEILGDELRYGRKFLEMAGEEHKREQEDTEGSRQEVRHKPLKKTRFRTILC